MGRYSTGGGVAVMIEMRAEIDPAGAIGGLTVLKAVRQLKERVPMVLVVMIRDEREDTVAAATARS